MIVTDCESRKDRWDSDRHDLRGLSLVDSLSAISKKLGDRVPCRQIATVSSWNASTRLFQGHRESVAKMSRWVV